MPTAIPELIALEIVSRLEAITVANGYFTNVVSVDRLARLSTDWRPRNLTVVVEQGAESPNEENSHEGNPPAIAYDLDFEIHAIVRDSDGSTTPHSTTENAFVAAIKKAITTGDQWWTFDSNAINAEWGTTVPYQSPEGDNNGVTVPLVVIYRVSETDPFTSR